MGRTIFNRIIISIVITALLRTGTVSAAIGTGPSAHPKRIVSTNLCLDELVVKIADPATIAGVTRYEQTPDVKNVLEQEPEIKRISGYLEEVLSLDPDLVLAGVFSHRETTFFLRRLGIPIITFEVPKNFEDIYANIRLLAETVGRSGAGEDVIEGMKKRLAELDSENSAAPRGVIYQMGGIAQGAETFEHAILEAAGIRNIMAESGIKGHRQISLEYLISKKPDVIVIPTDENDKATMAYGLMDHPAIRKGLQETKIIHMPGHLLLCGSPVAVEAAEFLKNEITN